jgi:hypothetical protein
VFDQLPDLVERQAGALSDVDDREPPQHRLVIATLTRHARGLGKQPDVLVVADERDANSRPVGDLSDAQMWLDLVHALDLNPT